MEQRAVHAFLQPYYLLDLDSFWGIQHNHGGDGEAGDGKQIFSIVRPWGRQQQANVADRLVRVNQAGGYNTPALASSIRAGLEERSK
jgi:hypothetical protein